MQAIELTTDVRNGHVEVPAQLEGHRVRVIILDHGPSAGSVVDAIWADRSKISAPIRFLTRDEANSREP